MVNQPVCSLAPEVMERERESWMREEVDREENGQRWICPPTEQWNKPTGSHEGGDLQRKHCSIGCQINTAFLLLSSVHVHLSIPPSLLLYSPALILMALHWERHGVCLHGDRYPWRHPSVSMCQRFHGEVDLGVFVSKFWCRTLIMFVIDGVYLCMY